MVHDTSAAARAEPPTARGRPDLSPEAPPASGRRPAPGGCRSPVPPSTRSTERLRGMADAQRYESGLVVEERGHVRVLTLDRPDRRNALSSALQADLVEELLRCGEDGDVRAVVLAATGPAFCAGFDLDEIREQDRRGERFRDRKSV